MADKEDKSHVNRRMFILGSATAGMLAAQQEKTGRQSASLLRAYELNRNWLFGGRTRAGVSEPAFDDSAWRRVTLPHSNALLPWHSFDEHDFQYVSAYRRRFRALPEWKGKRVFLDFGGAMTASRVTVTGRPFDEYKGG